VTSDHELRPITAQERCRHYATVARAIAFVQGHVRRQPSLDEIAAAVHLSPHHLQRLFSQWAGISPKRFLQHLTRDAVLQRLRTREDVLTVAADCGLSSGSRVHDLMVQCEAVTPGQVSSGGRGLTIRFGCGPTPFGEALVGWTDRGICHLEFLQRDLTECLAALAARWPQAQWTRDDVQARGRLDPLFGLSPRRGAIHLLLRGTNFQLKVWTALLAIGPGRVVSYGELARRAGAPRASRAVGSALAANTIAALIPCHRVVRESGEFNHYRWGVERKIALIGWEATRSGNLSEPSALSDAPEFPDLPERVNRGGPPRPGLSPVVHDMEGLR
jgi:AraC family transcriptional regulator of adaptative response/methylated-DNA-[protein]-cysteine methyltransferase